jgi:TPP-dependent pyruvate/acetoin dehydrogenase alpha subunit
VKRYPAFEFPEYVDWRPDPAVQAAFAARVHADPARAALIGALDLESLLDLYDGLVRARLHDVYLKRWVKQGVITKAWLGSGEEAVTIGACAALGPDDVVGPMIRNAAACFQRGMRMAESFAAYLGTTDSITGGRDLHIGDPARGVIPPISHIGDLVPVMTGCALAFKLRGEPRVALTWTGDGSTATGAVHEGLRTALSTRAPLVVFIQDNQVALGTDRTCSFPGDFADLGPAYGMAVHRVDGNHVLDVYAATRLAVDFARGGGGPVLIVARTFRMGGHATHDEREARDLFPAEVFAEWGKRDPVGTYETWLQSTHGVSVEALAEREARVEAEVDAAAREALAKRATHEPDGATVTAGVYAPSTPG